MSGSLLRLVSTVLLLVVSAVSTARAICVLPCFTETAPSAASRNHCEHSASAATTAIDGHNGACHACDDVGIDRADRVSLRNSTAAWLAASADVSVAHVFGETFDLIGHSGPPPGLLIPTSISVPLRI
ncbi:MAG TPA: hypothetical protein VGD94_09320 [Vicinamibacterales bacterium]